MLGILSAIEVFVTIFECFLILHYFGKQLEIKYKYRVYIVVGIITCTIITLVDYFQLFMSAKLLLIMLYYLLIAIFLYGGRLGNKAIHVLIVIALLVCSDFITFGIDVFITNLARGHGYALTYNRLLMFLISKVIFSMLIQLCTKHPIKKYVGYKIRVAYWILLFSIPVISIIIFYIVFTCLNETTLVNDISILTSVAAIFLLLLNVVVLTVFDSILKGTQTEIELENIKWQSRVHDKYVEHLVKRDKEVRGIRHDMHNHMFCMHSFLVNGQNESGIEYLSQITKQLNRTAVVVSTGHTIVDALLNEKISLARSKNVEISTDIRLNEDLKVENTDLCIIIGNILDNAVEAASKCEKGLIKFKLVVDKGLVMCVVINNYTGKLIKTNGRFVTTKKNPQEHSIGLENIHHTVRKYLGDVEILTENQTFKIKFDMENCSIE